MSKAREELLIGLACAAVGFALWRFAEGVEIPVLDLPKVGIVLMVVGVAGVVYGVVVAAASRRD